MEGCLGLEWAIAQEKTQRMVHACVLVTQESGWANSGLHQVSVAKWAARKRRGWE